MKDELTEMAFNDTGIGSNMSYAPTFQFLQSIGAGINDYRVVPLYAKIIAANDALTAKEKGLDAIARQAISEKCEYITSIKEGPAVKVEKFTKGILEDALQLEMRAEGLVPLKKK